MLIVQFSLCLHLALSNLPFNRYSLSGCEIVPNSEGNFRVFDRDSTNTGRITNLKSAGEIADRTAQYTY
jgi:hypothetical protein